MLLYEDMRIKKQFNKIIYEIGSKHLEFMNYKLAHET